ncbi:MAG: VWA domain-containing protein [Gemmatimonadota bacterium]
MSFARPDLLPLVLLVPALLILALWGYASRRRRMAARFSDAHLLTRLGGADLLRFPTTRLVIIALAGAALATAAAGPRWGLRATEGRSMSLNVVIAADISKSMLAEDISPNRLERARLFGRRLLRELAGDRFGLVVFAGRAYVLSPLTVDQSALALYLDALDPEMVSQGGSSLAAAIAQATDLVRGAEEGGGDRAVVLMSDGEALEEADAVRAAADRAARANVRFITVGFGTPGGARIPDVDPRTGEMVGFKRDEYGEIVMSRLDDELLRTVAQRTGGSYVRADQEGAVEAALGELRRMQRTEGDETQGVEPRERFGLFAALGGLLLVLDTLLFGPAVRLRRPAPPEPAPVPARLRAPGHRRMRRVAVLLLALAGLGLGIGDVERGNRLYREGRYEEAVAAYQRAVDSGDASPQVHYNLGTALLALGRYADAEQHFQNALSGVEPELRQRTFYNLGNRFLNEARADADVERQGELLDAAIEAYRRSLRIAPSDADAKWNLELALRERDENEQRQQSMPQQQDDPSENDEDQDQDQQGGGSGAGGAEGQSGEGDEAGASAGERPMSEEEADRILSAIEQDERELTRDKLRRGQRRTPVLRDW